MSLSKGIKILQDDTAIYYGKCNAGLDCLRILKLGVKPQCIKSGAAAGTREFALYYISVNEVHTVMAFQLQQRVCETQYNSYCACDCTLSSDFTNTSQ